MKQRAALLKDSTKPQSFHITLQLQEAKTAEFIYNDRDMARNHYEQLRAQMVCGGLAIKQIGFREES